MTKTMISMQRIALFLAGVLAALAVHAAGGGENLEHANTQVSNRAMLQRGAAMYMDYCAGCHSLKYVRYSRLARDLGLSEEQVMANLVLGDGKFGDTIENALTEADGTAFFGKAPPDLSLVARSRGVDWVYTYMKSFYRDPSAVVGWNNTLLTNASMPHVLWELQGIQEARFADAGEPGADPVVEQLELVQGGLLSPGQYDAALRDLASFLEYAGEPAVLQRKAIGVWVLLFLSLFTLLAWFLQQEYWKDVH
jgi:ubiquinol-cytochrome c reductase cytochrome c1 subunit